MAESNNDAVYVTDDNVFDLYRSLDLSKRDEDRHIVIGALENGVVPEVVRYGIMRDVYRGVVKSMEGELYYFNYLSGKELKVIKADTPTKQWEAGKLLKTCRLGCDFVKGSTTQKNEEEEDTSAIPSGEQEKKADPGGVALPNATVQEDQNIRDQQMLTTEEHSGGAGATTPDPTDGGKWHQNGGIDTQKSDGSWKITDLLRGLGSQLQSSPLASRQPSPKEIEYMTQVMGRSPQDIAEGNNHMSSTDRMKMNQWLQRSMNKSLVSLESWLERNGRE